MLPLTGLPYVARLWTGLCAEPVEGHIKSTLFFGVSLHSNPRHIVLPAPVESMLGSGQLSFPRGHSRLGMYASHVDPVASHWPTASWLMAKLG